MLEILETYYLLENDYESQEVRYDICLENGWADALEYYFILPWHYTGRGSVSGFDYGTMMELSLSHNDKRSSIGTGVGSPRLYY
jgi:hypothetical protein